MTTMCKVINISLACSKNFSLIPHLKQLADSNGVAYSLCVRVNVVAEYSDDARALTTAS